MVVVGGGSAAASGGGGCGGGGGSSGGGGSGDWGCGAGSVGCGSSGDGAGGGAGGACGGVHGKEQTAKKKKRVYGVCLCSVCVCLFVENKRRKECVCEGTVPYTPEQEKQSQTTSCVRTRSLGCVCALFLFVWCGVWCVRVYM